jgi:hypothetical protein
MLRRCVSSETLNSFYLRRHVNRHGIWGKLVSFNREDRFDSKKASISGIAAVTEVISRPEKEWRKVVAVSRRPPVLDPDEKRLIFKSVDVLGDDKGLEKALKEAIPGFYYAYVE